MPCVLPFVDHYANPLYLLPASQTFEIILTLEGITPETGNTIQVTLQDTMHSLQYSTEHSQLLKGYY